MLQEHPFATLLTFWLGTDSLYERAPELRFPYSTLHNWIRGRFLPHRRDALLLAEAMGLDATALCLLIAEERRLHQKAASRAEFLRTTEQARAVLFQQIGLQVSMRTAQRLRGLSIPITPPAPPRRRILSKADPPRAPPAA